MAGARVSQLSAAGEVAEDMEEEEDEAEVEEEEAMEKSAKRRTKRENEGAFFKMGGEGKGEGGKPKSLFVFREPTRECDREKAAARPFIANDELWR